MVGVILGVFDGDNSTDQCYWRYQDLNVVTVGVNAAVPFVETQLSMEMPKNEGN